MLTQAYVQTNEFFQCERRRRFARTIKNVSLYSLAIRKRVKTHTSANFLCTYDLASISLMLIQKGEVAKSASQSSVVLVFLVGSNRDLARLTDKSAHTLDYMVKHRSAFGGCLGS